MRNAIDVQLERFAPRLRVPQAVLLVTNDGRTRVLSDSASFAYDLLAQ